jgi:hypothetical protein
VLAALGRLERIAAEEPEPPRFCAALARELGRPVRFTPGERPAAGRATAVVGRGRLLGWLWLQGGPLDEVARALLEPAAGLLGAAIAALDELAAVRRRRHSALLADLLTGDLDRATGRARTLGIDLAEPIAVGFAAGENDDLAARLAAIGVAAIAAPFGDGAAAVCPGARPPELARVLAACATGPVAVAPQAMAMAELTAGLAAARIAALATSQAPAGGEDGATELAREVLRPVLEHDGRRGELLVPTLWAYLASGGNVSEAARRIGVHVNTLRYRLGRLAELGIELEDPEVRFAANLALRARHGALSSTYESGAIGSSAFPEAIPTGGG